MYISMRRLLMSRHIRIFAVLQINPFSWHYDGFLWAAVSGSSLFCKLTHFRHENGLICKTAKILIGQLIRSRLIEIKVLALEVLNQMVKALSFNGVPRPLISTSFISYCKTLNICGIKISRFPENDILAGINLGGHEYHVSRK